MSTNQRPNLITVIAAMTLASGIVNVIWGIVASHGAISSFIGIVCVPFTILPTVLGIFEILYASRLFNTPVQPARPSSAIAAFEIASILAGNAFALVVGILSLVFYSDLTVKRYFDEINGMAAPASAPEPAPVEAAPSQPEEPPSPRKIA
jgi:hypothetical protein